MDQTDDVILWLALNGFVTIYFCEVVVGSLDEGVCLGLVY